MGVIGPLDLERFEEDPERTLYVLDVRDPAEFRAGIGPGPAMRRAANWCRAPTTGSACAMRAIVLVDDTGVRARMTAAWLRQMGHRDVFVVEGALEAAASSGRALAPVPELALPVSSIDVTGLVALLDRGEGTVVIDLARSIDFRDGHIPGAQWGVRSRLDVLRPQLAGASYVVLTSPDGVLARLAVDEMKALTGADVLVLEGGTEAWHAFGRPLVKDRTSPPDEACIDAYLRPYDRNSGVEEAMNGYLTWEIELVHQIERDDTVAFGTAQQVAA